MITAGENLKFLLKKYDLEANYFDKLMKWSRGTTSRYQGYEDKAPPIPECLQIIEYFNLTLDDFVLKNLEKVDNPKKLESIVSEPQTEYRIEKKDVLSDIKIDIIESERQLYERIIKSKDETIEVLKTQIENLKK